MTEFDLSAHIDTLLAERRPDRYEVASDDGWLDEIADEIAHLIPMSEAQFRSARYLVGQRERAKTKRTNQLLRDIYESRQLPLDWFETLNLPLAVLKERVAIRACTADDFKNFANEERRVAASEFSVRNQTCEAAEWIHDEMVSVGARFGRDLSEVIEVGGE